MLECVSEEHLQIDCFGHNGSMRLCLHVAPTYKDNYLDWQWTYGLVSEGNYSAAPLLWILKDNRDIYYDVLTLISFH